MNIAILHPCPVCITITIIGYIIFKNKKNGNIQRNIRALQKRTKRHK